MIDGKSVPAQAGSGFWPRAGRIFFSWSEDMNMHRLTNLAALAVVLVPLLAVIPLQTAAWSVADTPSAQPTAEPAMAHAPRFDDKSIWPDLTGKEAFFTQKWPKARVLVWAQPGTSGAVAKGTPKTKNQVHVMNAADWLENGKPASAPPDADTDIVLPDAGKAYSVFLPEARHITIGRNASAAVPRLIGNLWIKAGGKYGTPQGRLRIRGDQHTFFRNDNGLTPAGEKPQAGKKAPAGLILGHDLIVQKHKDASVEFLGVNRIGDEVVMWEGTVILGPQSTFKTGWPSTQVIGPEAAMVLMSGSYFGKEVSGGGPVDIHVLGSVFAGTPDRPLTRDATLGVSSPNFQKTNKGQVQGGQFGLLIDRQARLAVHSQDPTKARLILKWNEGIQRGEQTVAVGDKINLTLLGKLDLNGVVFDQVALGGIRLPDPSQRTQWKNVFYGPKNAGKPDELYAKFDGDAPKAATQGLRYLEK